MPINFHHKLSQQAELGLWHLVEDELFFAEQMNLHPDEEKALVGMIGHRRLEWLAARWLLHQMSGRKLRGACLKDEFGKPYLQGSLFDISISHSREYIAVAAAPDSIGVDVQKIVGKIGRIAHKFMREEEFASLKTKTELEHLHVYWGAKEALYKAYGRKKLDFKEHILVTPFDYDLSKGSTTGQVVKGDFSANYKISYRKIEDYILVLAQEQTKLYAG